LLGFTSRANHPGLGNQLGQQLQPLGHQLDEEESEAREVATRPGETGDQALLDRVAAGEDDRDRRGLAFRRERGRGAAACHDHVDLAADEVGGQRG